MQQQRTKHSALLQNDYEIRELYQGIDMKDKGGRIGLISYMRTDSVNMSEQAIAAIRELIVSKFGKEYLNETPRRYKTKSRVAQEAHEAIRPTHFELTPDSVKQYLTPQQHKLYSLIWRRAVATQMKQVLKKIMLSSCQATLWVDKKLEIRGCCP
jgi:DNA topoisomerase-1